MSSVVNLDPESNPKLKEIFDILLLAGYFRIRIPSITPLDKILGGLSWCITQSNFSIDIEFSDEFNIGQKIKVSEKIVSSLHQMQCPYQLSPHQIQGLDLNALYPIVQWLIKFVLETREFRQDQNKRVTKLVGRNAFQALQDNDLQERQAIREIVNQLDLIKDTRHTKNMKMATHDRRDPLRVYSALMEYGDLSSQRTYNKLCAIVSGISETSKKGGQQQKQQQPLSIGQMLFQDGKIAEQNIFSGMQKITVENIENINNQRMQQVQQQIQEMSKTNQQQEEEHVEQATFSRMERRRKQESLPFQLLLQFSSIAGQNIARAIENQRDKISESMKKKEEEEDEMLTMATRLKQEKELNLQQIELQKQNIYNFDAKLEEVKNEILEMEQQEQELVQEKEQLGEQKKKMDETIAIIEQKSRKIKVSEQQVKQAEELVQKRNELKEERSQLKKQIKEELKNLEREREVAERDLPQEDEVAMIQELKEEYNRKKEKYDKKFTQFSQLNQELMVLQRKIENIPSASEIAQYHQRFIELYEAINREMEEYKKQQEVIQQYGVQAVHHLQQLARCQAAGAAVRGYHEDFQGELSRKPEGQEGQAGTGQQPELDLPAAVGQPEAVRGRGLKPEVEARQTAGGVYQPDEPGEGVLPASEVNQAGIRQE